MKRYRTPIDVTAAPDGQPVTFEWRDRIWTVATVLGHWREDPGWWRNSQGGAVKVRQADLWRVEATAPGSDRLICEVVQREEGWKLQNVWD